MKRKKITSLVLSALMMLNFAGQINTVSAADPEADNPAYTYIMTDAEDSAYVYLGETIESKDMEFIDGMSLGITDQKDPYYNELVTLDGLYARKQYNANSAYFKVSDKFYNEGDNEFLFSLVFYDFGPSRGTFYLEYHTVDGDTKTVTLIKPGTNPGWAVKTICVDDIDLSKTYDNGATVRIINGAYNAFKKFEVVNVSKAKREKTNPSIVCLGSEMRTKLEDLYIIKEADERFTNQQLSKPCTSYDAQTLKNIISGTDAPVSASLKNQTMTQGELIKTYMQALNLSKNEDESYVDAANRWGFINANGFFIHDDAPATNFNLMGITYSALAYENGKGDMLLKNIIANGYYEKIDVASIEDDAFQYAYYLQPRFLPYQTIFDNTTGRKFKYINLFGADMMRGYLNTNSWLPDGSGFVCGTTTGHFYLYDINTQMLTYLDQGKEDTKKLPVTVGLNGWVYYIKIENNIYNIWRIHPRTHEKEKVFSMPKGVTVDYLNVTNDGRYIAPEGHDNGYVLERPKDTTAIIRLDVEEQKLEYRYYSFPYSNYVNHFQVNPVYPDIMGFSHETVTATHTYGQMLDRCNIMDFTTGEVIKYNQGDYGNTFAVQLVTHEIWSFDGEHRYFCSWATDKTKDSGTMPAVVRINKDGTHRQYYAATVPLGGANHATVSGDEKMICFDQSVVALIATETHQVFPVVTTAPIIAGQGHPYHPHPHVSYTGNLASWGHVHNGVLGIAWIDYTDILENEVAKGGRYEFGEDVSYVSYKGIECESKLTTKAGKECLTAKPDKEIFFDINSDIVDTDNDAVKITFDYYDNSTKPLIITYSKGVEEVNDAWKYFNKTINVKRTGTNKWKTTEIIIDCGNFENIGKFETDFKIKGDGLSPYITNVRVEAIGN